MAEKLDFNTLIATNADDVKPPVTLPTGHYRAMISGPMSPHSAKSGNVAMRFPIKLIEPTDDVDAEQLAEAGGIPDKSYTIDFWMSPDAQYRFTDFAKSCGVHTEGDGLTLSEIAERLVENSTEFTIEVQHQQSDRDPEKTFMRLDNPVGDNA